MKKLIKLGLVIVGAAVLTFTMANATADEGAETMKCEAGKCDSGKSMKCGSSKDDKREVNTTKPVPEKGKCGTGKCG